MPVFAPSRPSRSAALAALGLSLAACVDIVGVENLTAAPAAAIDAGAGGSAGKDGGDSGFSGASGTITIDAPVDAVSEVAADASGDSEGSDAAEEPGPDASPCPPVRPVQGTDCAGTLECVYDACSLATLDLALAVCQAGKWAVFSQPCALYPCGYQQCMFPRLLCVSVQGGTSSCAENPCISSLSFGASCACAKDLCDVVPTYQCNPATTASYLVSCTP